ncbi:MAG: amino acid ABC transporter substrate-binding protein [Thermodesulfobacteriota bacterium]
MIKIGISISLSGRYWIQGKESFEGLLLWTKDVNDSGGIFLKDYDKKVPLRLFHYDDESSADKCKKNVEKLILNDRVDLLIGPYSSGLALAVAPLAEELKKTIWNHGGSSDDITNRGLNNVVSAITPASEYFKGIIEMVRKIDGSARGIAVFGAEDSGFAANVAFGAKVHGEDMGFEVVQHIYQSGIDDFTPLLRMAREREPDLILGAGRMEDDLLLAEQILRDRIKAKAIGLVVAGIKLFHEELGERANGFLSSSQWERGMRIKPDFGPTPALFFNSFKGEYGKEPDYVAAQGFNIGLIIQRCIEGAGTLDGDALREEANRADFKTFYGHFRIDPVTGRQLGHRNIIIQWQGGRKYIVCPEEMAEAKLMYPGPWF